ncbi:MAG: alpha/beta fold hydrolase [Alphaproteobacteria bacterium]|nr:alpha/beta fold hydrolase [Alphaproteobacteria bacterium]
MARKISAVLSLDVVDYTRRMAEDEDATLKELQRLLSRVVRPAVQANSGRIFKLMGDGALVEFDTAAAAIAAAGTILQKMHDDSMSLRAGIHAGDVMVNGDDLFGEAVNVAARLQTSAQPGTCLVSKTAVEVAGTSLGVSLRPESSMRLKGVPNPVEAYSIDLDGDKRRAKNMRQSSTQDIRFATSKDGTTLAWTSTGEGRRILATANWIRHLEYDWTMNTIAGWIPLLSERYSLLRYDGRNNGLSERGVADVSLERLVEDIEAVLDSAGIERIPLFGISFGATIAAAFAARHPDRVAGLVLLGGFAQGLQERQQPGIAAHGRAMMEMGLDGWNDDYPSARDLMAQSFAPGASPHDQRTYAEFMKVAMDHQDYLRIGPVVANVDIVDLLPDITCPAIVLHANKDRMHNVEQGRRLASGIGNARLIGLDTINNTMPEYDPAWPKALAEIEGFLDTL